MTETRDALLPPTSPTEDRTTGVVPSQLLRHMVDAREITALEEIEPGQVQPASLDLRLGDVAYRIRSSFLPGPEHTVADRIESMSGDIGVVRLQQSDVVRHPLVAQMLDVL